MQKKTIISGVAPGPSGVGRVLEYLIDNSINFKFLHPPRPRKNSIKKHLINFNIVLLLSSIVESVIFFFEKKKYQIIISNISKKDIILIHPQTIGYSNCIGLIERNKTTLYIMDNSFFCIKSYNYLDNSKKSCDLCINGNYHYSKINKCKSFPVSYDYEEYFHFVNFLRLNYRNIKFLAQNIGQVMLLESQFGLDIEVKTVGLLTSDLFQTNHVLAHEVSEDYDFVFHGDSTLAKGSEYVFELAKLLPTYTFLFPFDKPEHLDEFPNITYKAMLWNSGLKDCVISSKITLCPSIWSAPIEGSVMKTLNLGKCLAVYVVENSFASEINDNAVIKLSGDVIMDISILKDVIESNRYLIIGENGKHFATQKLEQMKVLYNMEFKIG